MILWTKHLNGAVDTVSDSCRVFVVPGLLCPVWGELSDVWLCCRYRADTQTYQPYNKDWIKEKIYVLLRRQAQQAAKWSWSRWSWGGEGGGDQYLSVSFCLFQPPLLFRPIKLLLRSFYKVFSFFRFHGGELRFVSWCFWLINKDFF